MSAPAPRVGGKPQEEVQRPPASPSSRGSGIVSAAASAVKTGVHLADRILNGSDALSAIRKVEEGVTDKPKHLFVSLFEQLQEGTLVKDVRTLVTGVIQATEPLDDRRLLLEQVVTLLSTLPDDSPIGGPLQNLFIRILWQDLPKPPLTFVGESRYRSADGSGNNPFYPKLGAAGQPYARTVPAMHPMPDTLPDPSDVFDILMKRELETFKPHPSGISSLLFSYAVLITHSCFNTNLQDPNINDASSYLDLSPVYGNNEEQMMSIRTMKDGEIHPDAVASQRLFLMPPSVIALAIVFSRNHNSIAQKLREINQNDRFPPAETLDDEGKKKQDEDLFQTARNVNTGWFMNVIFQDYIRCILHVNSTMSTWSLVPTEEIKTLVEGRLPRGTGNALSVEFNLLYRWHCAISEKDEKWIEGLVRRYTNVPFDEMTRDDFIKIVKGLSEEMGDDPLKWTFGGLRRTGKDGAGPFSDDDIVRTLTEATDTIAGAFGAKNVPAVMKVIDCLGMRIARTDWNCASLNEFREFLGLTKLKSFKEWNSDPVVAENARRLYKDIDNLELMPGLACEQAKPSMEGSGLCPGYTISRAILSDATALVRGDRYLTTDYNAGNLTSFQWKDVQPDLENGAFGGSIGKLLMRHFPSHYTFNSTYALFPFTTPHTTGEILKNLKIAERYDASRPTPTLPWATVHSRKAVEEVLNDEGSFANIYGPHIAALQDKYSQPPILSHFKAFDTPAKRADCLSLVDSVMFPQHWAQKLFVSVGEATKQQISESAWATSTGPNGMLRLDVVSDLVVPVAMNHLAKALGLPMKTKEQPLGFTPEILHDMLTNCYSFAFLNYDPTIGYKLRERAKRDADIMRSLIEFRINQVNGTPSALHTIAHDVRELLTGKTASSGLVLSNSARDFYENLLEKSNRPLEELAGILQTAATNYVTCVSSTVAVVDFLLEEKNKSSLDDVCKLTRQNVGAANESKIMAYVEEALRLAPPVTGVARRSKVDTTISDGKEQVRVSPEQLVWVDLVSANRDATTFPDPMKVKVDRPAEAYKLVGRRQGLTSKAGESFNTHFATAMIREIAQHRVVARVPGKSGELGAIEGVMGIRCYKRDDQTPSSFPTHMEIQLSVAKGSA